MAPRRGSSRLWLPDQQPQVPSDGADDLTWLLFHQFGVIARRQALRHMSGKALRHRVETERWQQVHRGVYVTHNGQVTQAQMWWIAVLAAGTGAVLAGISAAQAGGLRRYGDGRAHVLIPSSRRTVVAPNGVIVHRTLQLDERDILRVGLPRRTTAARSLVDGAQWARTDDQARAIIAAGFQQGLVTGVDVERVVARLRRARRRHLILLTARDAAGGSQALSELDLMALVRAAGLPEPSRQHVRHDASGRKRYLDVYFDEWGVHVEVDGGYHLDPRTSWADMRRQNDVWIAGDRVLRFPAWALRAHPDQVIAQLRAALRAAGWPG